MKKEYRIVLVCKKQQEYNIIMDIMFNINEDLFHQIIRKRHILCHEHSPPVDKI